MGLSLLEDEWDLTKSFDNGDDDEDNESDNSWYDDDLYFEPDKED